MPCCNRPDGDHYKGHTNRIDQWINYYLFGYFIHDNLYSYSKYNRELYC